MNSGVIYSVQIYPCPIRLAFKMSIKIIIFLVSIFLLFPISLLLQNPTNFFIAMAEARCTVRVEAEAFS